MKTRITRITEDILETISFFLGFAFHYFSFLKKRHLYKPVFTILLIIITSSLSATTYYISPTGLDSNPGTSAAPFATLHKASTVAVSGDIIHLTTGTFTEALQSSIVTGVSIEGEGKTVSIIKCHYNDGSTNVTNCQISLYSSTMNIAGNQTISGIKFDGDNLTAKIGISIYGRGNVSIHDCDFVNFELSACGFYGESHGETGIEPTTYTTGNTFYNNTFNNCSKQNTWPSGVWYSGQDGFTLHDNILINTSRGLLDGDIASGQSNRRLKIYNNTFTRGTQLSYPTPTYWDFVGEIRWNFGECEFYNNTCSGSVDLCYTYKQSLSYGFKVYNNTMGFDTQDNNHNIALSLEADTYNVEIYNNHFKNVTYALTSNQLNNPVSGLSTIASDITFRNNLCENLGYVGYPGGSGVFISGGGAPTVSNIFIYNNTITACTTGSYAYQWGIQVPRDGTVTNVKIQNNIIEGFSYAPIVCDVGYTGSVTINGLFITNNDFYANGNNNNPLFSGVTPTNYTTSNVLKVDPLFTPDFHLMSNSPAIGAGTDVGYGTDLGAFSYVATKQHGIIEQNNHIMKVTGKIIKQ